MRPIRIPGAGDRPLDAPSDWDETKDGVCGRLFVRREVVGDIQYMRSAWEVEFGEAASLLAGAPMTLGVSGNQHPVVQLGIGELPADFDPVIYSRILNRPNGERYVRVELLFPHKGGMRAFAEVPIVADLAAAIARGVQQAEDIAAKEGWTRK